MQLQFLGANRQVTGSRYCLKAGGATILIDCGMFQERKYLDRNWEPSPLPPKKIDAAVLTHAHLDHCGLLPRLVGEGFKGPVFATAATADLAELILEDSAGIQAEDIAYKKRRHRKEGRKAKHPEVTLFTPKDVRRTLSRFQRVAYQQPVRINDRVSAVFHDAGHILGSAMVELKVRENGDTRRLVFSGDIGQWDKPIIRNPSVFTQADFVVMESTYGNRNHDDHGEDRGDVPSQLARIISHTIKGGGNVVIPTFAIERAQELIYHIGRLLDAGRIPDVPVFLNSPMAIDATEVFRRHRECFDEDAWRLISSGSFPLRFPKLTMTHSVDESKAIGRLREPAVIMATSGMCTAGRIKHHLRNNITRPESTILFVGYQARGTLGRQILDGNPEVRIHGRSWRVKARIEQIHGVSGHADRAGLLRWLGSLKSPPQQVFLTHGDEDQSLALADHVRDQMHWPVTVPEYQQKVELA